MSYNLIKLTTGEEIVCKITDETGTHTRIKKPLKIHTIPRFVTTGIVESLALIQWVKPYTEEDTVDIKNSQIIYSAKTSKGLSTFYEKQLDIAEQHGGFMTEKRHQRMIDDYHRELYAQSQIDNVKKYELEEEFEDYINDEDKTIH